MSGRWQTDLEPQGNPVHISGFWRAGDRHLQRGTPQCTLWEAQNAIITIRPPGNPAIRSLQRPVQDVTSASPAPDCCTLEVPWCVHSLSIFGNKPKPCYRALVNQESVSKMFEISHAQDES